MNKIKVLHVLLSGHFSGAENVACQIIENFKQEQIFDMAYASQDGSIRKILNKKKIKFLPMNKLNLLELKRIIRDYQPDIIHAHDATASVLSAVIAPNCPVISHLHSNPPWLKSINKNSLIYLFTSFFMNKILIVSNAITQEYIFRKCIQSKILSIGNPINKENIQLLSKKDLNINEKLDVIYIGRLDFPKNPIKYIEIIYKLKKKIPNVKAGIVGDGVQLQECKNLIEKLNLKDNIILYGFMENPYPILKNSKCLCITSDWEGYGLVAVEALSLGKPVVCTNVGGLPSLINDKCGKLCNESCEIESELYNLISNTDYLLSKSRGALVQVEMLEEKIKYMKIIEDVYVESLNRGNIK